MEENTIIEIPLKWLKTLDKDFYFEMFREMYYGTTQSRKETYYTLERIRTDLHLPEMYTTWESFEQSYYQWVRNKQTKDSLVKIC